MSGQSSVVATVGRTGVVGHGIQAICRGLCSVGGVGEEDMHVHVQVGNEAQTVMTGLFNVIIHVTSLRYLTCLNKELQVST